MGLNLSHNTAHILAPGDKAFITAAFHKAAASAHDTAQVVADVGVPHRAGIDAACYGAAGIARDTAGVRGRIRGIQIGGFGKIHAEIQPDILGIDGGVHAFGVYRCAAAAGDKAAAVVSYNTAGAVVTGYIAFRTTGAERSVIHTRDAAGIGLADNGSDERTVFNRTIVFPRNTAHGQSVAAGGDNSLNRQVFDYRRWLQDSKQSGGRQVLGQRKTADGMSAAVEAAAEGGYGGKIRFLQRNIRREQHLLIL